jgi:TonB-linked SusC/RagA family outer membrane protein
MRKLLCFILVCIVWLSNMPAYAQLKTITGTVTGEGDRPLSGVNVSVRGSDRRTQTSASGTFSISASAGEYLVFTYVGYASSEIRVTDQSSYDVKMGVTQSTMEEVVVTAMDIRRNPKELPFSVQKVSGNDIQESQRENFVNSLQGRVAGLTITPTSGMAGASSQIVLRGFNSIALSNSPLFVIDGIILDNSVQNENDPNTGFGARPNTAPAAENRNDYTNRIADLNPNDIESVTVLKGPEATALYGSQASSGAIVITTKKTASRGKVNVNYDNSFRWQKLTRFPEFQRLFSNGVSNGNPSAVFSYFGPKYDSTTTIYENSFDQFFRTGFAQTHNIGADYGGKNYTIRFSGSGFFQESPIPENTYTRYNARVSGSAKIGKYIDIQPSVSYIRSVNQKPLRGQGGYMLSLLAWPADNDFRIWSTPTGQKDPIYAANPNSETDNPFYNVYKNRSEDQTDRFVGTMGININPAKWLSLAGRFGYDTYAQDGFLRYDSMSSTLGSNALKGAQTNYYRRYYGYNHTITATGRHTIGDFTGRIMVGNMWQDYETQVTTVYGNNLASFSAKDSNYTDPATRFRNINMVRNGLPNYAISRQAAYFGEFAISWKNAIFLTYSHRFEESSLFPKQSRSYNYPAGGLSVMISDLVPEMKNSKILQYLKLRGSLASTARSGSTYSNQSVFNQNLGNGGGWYYGFTNANPYLEPETQQTYELGTEMRFFNNRINLDFTYYNTKNNNLIVELQRASYGTGFVLNTLNFGGNENTGIEIALDVVPVRNSQFTWSSRFNFNRMRNKVTDFPENIPEYYISDTWIYGNARGGLVRGGPTTSITAFGYLRNDKGEILISPTNGLPLIDNNFRFRGDRNPDFTLGSLNNFSFRNWKLSMLWDLKVGGDIFNGTEMYLTRLGRSLQSADRFTPRVINGVLKDGLENTANPTRNNIAIVPYYNSTYYTPNTANEGIPEEEYIQKDVNWLRLRDLTLSYTFSTASLKNNLRFVKSLSAFITGNDLILITNYLGADPAVNGVSAGSRGVGGFGFDFGNVGTPVSVNVGIRANF